MASKLVYWAKSNGGTHSGEHYTKIHVYTGQSVITRGYRSAVTVCGERFSTEYGDTRFTTPEQCNEVWLCKKCQKLANHAA